MTGLCEGGNEPPGSLKAVIECQLAYSFEDPEANGAMTLPEQARILHLDDEVYHHNHSHHVRTIHIKNEYSPPLWSNGYHV
ncbi:hypothetical protein ANN_12872 [Periplaneta americana]|uniref:Uncharacterized protein n=1 Tax=Periplaneta americana TaxID=6978 RepID=A0ABQ8TJY1_PERAM|nr:hypothetical protein ANN_12872 [Periplaneta americana]